MTINQEEIYNWLLKHPGYFKKDSYTTWEVYIPIKCSRSDFRIAFKKAKLDYKLGVKIINSNKAVTKNISLNDIFPGVDKFKNTIKENKIINKKFHSFKYDINNVIFIADLHAPWILDGYLEWCKGQQAKYNCGTVIFSGDIIDSGGWSYHEHDPDGLSVGDELYAAKKQLKQWYEAFPTAIVLYGNHDLLISRKAKTAGLSKHFLKDLGNIIDAPKNWKFVHEYIKDNVKYIHGSIGDAFKRAVDSRMSICQGHLHSKTFVQWSVSEKDAIFGLQVGGGFDRDKYAFDYAKPFAKKPIIGCGIILDKGTTPFVKLMPL